MNAYFRNLAEHDFTQIARNCGTERPILIKQLFMSRQPFFYAMKFNEENLQRNLRQYYWPFPMFFLAHPVYFAGNLRHLLIYGHFFHPGDALKNISIARGADNKSRNED